MQIDTLQDAARSSGEMDMHVKIELFLQVTSKVS